MTDVIQEEGAKAPEGECVGDSCPHCDARKRADEVAFAFLLALMPVISLTLFGQAGLL